MLFMNNIVASFKKKKITGAKKKKQNKQLCTLMRMNHSAVRKLLWCLTNKRPD